MKIAFFDCFAGASGDMILGALLDTGLEINFLEKELAKLKLTGYKIQSAKQTKKGISGTKFDVIVTDEHHPHRSLKEIFQIIDQSRLGKTVKEKSKTVFTRLALAEAKIHNKTIEEIHFHEVGAVDAIIDIVGAVIGLELLGIGSVHVSKIRIGTGSLECAHGTLPVPPPATLELLKTVPVESAGIEAELVTPTGAAILSTLADGFGALPSMTLLKTGYGLGSRDLEIPNVLRIIIGEKSAGDSEISDTVQLIETNIDDMNPQFYEHIMETLFAGGAKDVFLTPIIMKKNRPGVVLSILAEPDLVDTLCEVVFKETTTLGVRISEIKKRKILERDVQTVKTPWGEARVKIRKASPDRITFAPEYDDCKYLAQKNNLPIQTVYDTVKKEAEKKMSSQ